MQSEPIVQHWLVSVARASGLDGAGELRVSSGTRTDEAWKLVASRTGVTERDLAARVARHYRLEIAELPSADVHAHKLLPAHMARDLRILALCYTDRTIVVATADPVGMEAERAVAHVSGRNVEFRIAPPSELAAAVERTYREEAQDRPAAPPAASDADTGPKVLVVDDDADTRLMLHGVLEQQGFRVDEAEDGTQAMEMLTAGDRYDLVTLDLQMEEMHGLEVLRRIRTSVATANLPVVVATGSDSPAVEMELFEAGADDFVVKPVDPPRFLLRVRAVLRRRSAYTPGIQGSGPF